MFTSASTKPCECFVWGRPLPQHTDIVTQSAATSRAVRWGFSRTINDDGARSSQTRPAPAAWDIPCLRTGRNSAFTLIEVMVASALALLTVVAVGSLSWYSGRSFVAIANYVDLDQTSQFALDKMSREIRQAHRVMDYSATSLTLLDVDNNPLNFTYDPGARTLVRVSGGQTNTLLTGCDFLQFAKYQHTAISNTFDAYDPAYVTNTRLIQVTWKCSRKILGAQANSESVQSAKIALRNN